MFEDFWGNAHVTRALEQMAAIDRLPQTMLFAGPEGVGKATLARRLGAALLGHGERIEQDDLSLPDNVKLVAEREKMPPDRRNEDPLLFASHPDFVTFAPDGPLRQLTIPQSRLLKERAAFMPMHGNKRIFLIDHIDRANEQAANSLLKTLEEPPLAPAAHHDGGERLQPAADHPLARGAVSLRAAGRGGDAGVRRGARSGRAAAADRAGRRQSRARRFRSIWRRTTSAARPCSRC